MKTRVEAERAGAALLGQMRPSGAWTLQVWETPLLNPWEWCTGRAPVRGWRYSVTTADGVLAVKPWDETGSKFCCVMSDWLPGTTTGGADSSNSWSKGHAFVDPNLAVNNTLRLAQLYLKAKQTFIGGVLAALRGNGKGLKGRKGLKGTPGGDTRPTGKGTKRKGKSSL